MKLTKRLFILLFLALYLCSCTNDTATHNAEQNRNINTTLPNADSTDDKTPNTSIETLLYNIIGENALLSAESINDNVIMLAVKNNDGLCECHFIDILKEQELSTVTDIDLTRFSAIYFYNDTYVLYSSNGFVYILNKDFSITNKIAIADTIYSGGMQNYCVLPHSNKILYYMTQFGESGLYIGLYSTDYQCTNSTLLLKLDSPEKNLHYLNGFTSMYPSYDEKSLYFTGYYYDSAASGADSKTCIGNINLESMDICIENRNMPYFHILKDCAIYYEGYLEDENQSSGELFGIQNNQTTNKWTLTEKIESQNIHISDKGNYILTYTVAEPMNASEIWQSTIACYDRKTGTRVCEYTMQVPQSTYKILLCEDKGILVYFYYDNGLKIATKTFNGGK